MVSDTSNALMYQVSVIGSLLIDEKCIGATLAELPPEDFLSDVYRTIYQAIRTLFTAGQTVDPVTVLGALGKDSGEGWYEIIKQCLDATPTAANVGEYTRLLRETARLYRSRQVGARLAEVNGLDDVPALLSELSAQMVERSGVKVTTMAEGLARFVERHKATPEYFRWGLAELDERLYIGRGKFVILGGYASDGKTALALSCAWEMAKTQRVGFYSLETDDGTLMDRLISSVTKIEMGRIKKSELTQEDYDDVARVSGNVISRNLELVLAAGMTAADIAAHAQSRRYDVIYVDYVQLIRSDRPRSSRTEQITAISIDLHTAAQSTGITIVGLSQLTRPEKSNGSRVAPSMSSLRESGQLEQDADAVILLYREKPDTQDSRRVLKIAKNKEGEVGYSYLAFDGATQTFRRHYNQNPPPKPKKKEPEYKQVELAELPSSTPVPF